MRSATTIGLLGSALCVLLLGVCAQTARAEDELPPAPPAAAGAARADVVEAVADAAADDGETAASESADEAKPGAEGSEIADEGGGDLVSPDDLAGADGSATGAELRDAIAAPASGSGLRRIRTRVYGSLRLRYRWRQAGGDGDHDLYQYLMLHVGEETEPGFSASFHGRPTQDLDGRGDNESFYVFDSITDTYDHRVNGRIYHAYGNWRPVRGLVEQVRIGRQYVEGGEFFHLDGVRVDLRSMARLKAGFYGGLPAHLFESTPSGDLMLGMFVEGVPWAGGTARLDLAYIDDETNYYGDEENVITTLTLRQRYNAYTHLWGAFQLIDSDPRTLRLHADTFFPGRDVSLRAAFYGLLDTQRERVTEVDPYYVIANELEPYWTGSVSASKGFGRFVIAEGGIDIRRLFDSADAGRFNHSFERYYATLSTENWPAKDMYLSLTGERWNSGDDFWTAGVEVEHRPNRTWRLQLGTDYALYRFDLYTANERQSVRSWYMRAVARPGKHWRLQLRVRVEDDAFDTYWTLDSSIGLEF